MILKYSFMAYYWSLIHLLSLFYINGKSRRLVSLFIIALIAPVYTSGMITGDVLNTYIHSVDNVGGYEWGVNYLYYFLSKIGVYGINKIYFIQIFILLVSLYSFVKLASETRLALVLSSLLLSPFLFLSMNNVLRQGLSSSFLLLLAFYLQERSNIKAILVMIVATLFHWSAPAFILVLLIHHFLPESVTNLFYATPSSNQSETVKVTFKGVFTIFLIFFITIAFLVLFFPKLISFVSDNSNRDFIGFKILFILLVYVVSTFISSNIPYGLRYLFRLRLIFIALFFSFSFFMFHELASRILLFYFGVELAYALKSIKVNFRFRISSILVFVAYSFSFNVLELITNFKLA